MTAQEMRTFIEKEIIKRKVDYVQYDFEHLFVSANSNFRDGMVEMYNRFEHVLRTVMNESLKLLREEE